MRAFAIPVPSGSLASRRRTSYYQPIEGANGTVKFPPIPYCGEVLLPATACMPAGGTPVHLGKADGRRANTNYGEQLRLQLLALQAERQTARADSQCQQPANDR